MYAKRHDEGRLANQKHMAQIVLKNSNAPAMHEAINHDLTTSQALETIEENGLDNTSVRKVTGLVATRHSLCSQKGPAALNTAREILSEMIKESATKYDDEITKCTSFYASHCSFMGIARSQTSAANYVATTSHALILDAQANIVRSEKDIPVTRKSSWTTTGSSKITLVS